MVEVPYVPSPEEIAEEKLEPILPQLHELLVETVDERAIRTDLRELLLQELSDDLSYSYWHLLGPIYAERQYEPVFVADSVLTPEGSVLLERLSDSHAHGLLPRDYLVDSARRRATRLLRAREVIDGFAVLELGTSERERLISAIAEHSALLEQEDAAFRESVREVLFPSDPELEPALPRVWSGYEARLRAQNTLERDAVLLELDLADGFLRYASDMRYGNPIWFEEDTREDEALLAAAQDFALSEAFRSGTGTGFESVADALPPHHQQYVRLVEAHRRYRVLAAAGGWPEVEDVDVRVGRSYDMIPALRQRLSLEGYFTGDLESREYSEDLRDAVQHYQVTHQFRENGRLSGPVVDSINTSALHRARQIAVSLQRWRESTIGDDEYYIFTNVNDFHTEVWRNGDRDMRIRTIVGSTQRVTRGGELVYARATPSLNRSLRYIVFNPYWNVPQNIMRNEYDPLLEEDPKWYQHNGFEIMGDSESSRWVRQLPGPGNALGEVKFLFPNPHDVYMHDTPNRRLFERTVRAFSHGCMRLENPLDLAEYIVANDRGWDRERMDEQRASGEEEWLTLRSPIPVHVEYYVVRVDDEGFTNFLADLYRYDRPLLDERERREREEALFQAEDGLLSSLARARAAASEPPQDADSSQDPEAQAAQR